MKYTLTLVAMLATMQLSAQVFVGLGPGYSFNGKGLVGDLGVGYQYKNIVLQAGYQSHIKSDEPVLLQLRAAIQLQIGETMYVQPFAGYSRYQMSSDDKSRNSNSYVAGMELVKFEMQDAAWFVGFTQTKQHSIISCGLRFWFSGGPWKDGKRNPYGCNY